MIECMRKSKPKLGRPKVAKSKASSCRHVVNVSQEIEAAARQFCEVNGIAKLTDAFRQLITKALRAEGLM
jgi:hypothetical protein